MSLHHKILPFQIVSHVAVEIGVVAEVIEPTMKVPGCHNLGAKNSQIQIKVHALYLIIFLKEEVKNLCSCVEPLQVEKYFDRCEPGVVAQVGLLSLPIGSPGSVLGKPKSQASIHRNSCLVGFAKHQQERSQSLSKKLAL